MLLKIFGKWWLIIDGLVPFGHLGFNLGIFPCTVVRGKMLPKFRFTSRKPVLWTGIRNCVSPRRSIFLIGLYNTTKAKSMRYNYYMVLVPRKLGIAELTYQWNYACNSQSGVNRIGQTNMLLFIYLIIHEAQSYIVTSMIRSLICAKNSKDFLCLI